MPAWKPEGPQQAPAPGGVEKGRSAKEGEGEGAVGQIPVDDIVFAKGVTNEKKGAPLDGGRARHFCLA